MTPMLTVEGLSVNYGPPGGLREVSIRVDSGELVCIVGPNGADKSSLMNAIAGAVIPRAGSAKFETKSWLGCGRSTSRGSGCR